MEIRVLGPLQVSTDDGEVVDLGGPRQRRLLSALALVAGETVSEDRLISAIWDGDEALPEAPKRALQTYVSRLRTALGPDSIRTGAGGYALDADVTVDAARFGTLVGRARRAEETGDSQGAEAAIGEALVLWRGEPFGDLVDVEWAEPDLARLVGLRLRAEEDRLTLLLQRGAVSELLPDVEALIARAPLAEGPRRVLMLALYRSGRKAEALRAFQDYRGLLADETGLDPSVELAELDQMIIADDPRLAVEVQGRQIRGYALGDKIAEGAFGDIYRGVQPSVGREVAIKVIRPELADDPEFVRRFEAEAQLVAHLEHPHIVPVVDFWREPGNAYLVMRYLRGGSAEQRLVRDGPWLLADVARLVDEIGPALAVAHAQGVVHRDVKPANILFDETGNSYLADFGIAVASAPVGAYQLPSAGSPLYASPEQIRDHRSSERSDIYSFGVVLHELLTGQSPFPVDTNEELVATKLQQPVRSLAELRTDLPAALDVVLQTATAVDPSDRFTDMGELVLAFRAAVTATPAAAVDTAEPGEAPRPRVKASQTLLSMHLELANPYKGLRAFDEADATNFFGRDELTADLVDRIGASRLIAVVGPSGSGKSSVVRAGVIPKLRADGAYVATIIPGSHPMDELETALLRMAPRPVPTLLDQLTADERGMGRCVKRLLPDDDRDLILVIDQFEELFILTEPDRRAEFLEGLATAVTDPRSRLRVMATLRADFIDRPLTDPTVSALIRDNTTLVAPLDPHELRAAITGPAERIGITVEPELVAELIAGVTGQPGSLPLLQYALTETYEHRTGTTLTHDTYQQIGGLTGALARRADQLYEQTPADIQPAIARLFTRLITPGEGTEDTRRRVPRPELTSIPSEVIDAYGDARLLSFDRDPTTREPTVEVAHEALIREWPRLRAWVDQDRDGLRTLRHLGTSAEAWEAADRDEGELYRGGRLEAAEEYATAHPDELNPTEQAFLQASIEHRDQQIATERRRLRRLRTLLTTVAVIAAVALIAGLVAVRQRNQADANATRAEAEKLAAAAIEQLDEDPERSILLAIQSLDLAETPNGLAALHQALQQHRTVWSVRYDIWESRETSVLHPDGQHVAILSEWGLVEYWDAGDSSGEPLWSTPLTGGAQIGFPMRGWIDADANQVTFPVSDLFSTRAVIGEHRGLYTLDLDTGYVVEYLPFEGCVAPPMFPPTGADVTALLTFVRQPTATDPTTCDLNSDPVVMVRPEAFRSEAVAVDVPADALRSWDRGDLSADGRFYIHSGRAGSYVFDTTTGEQLMHDDTAWGANLSPHGEKVLLYHDGYVDVRDFEKGTLLKTIPGTYSEMRFTPDGEMLVGLSWQRGVQVFDSETGRLIHDLVGPETRSLLMHFGSRSDRALVTDAETHRLWDLQANISQVPPPIDDVVPNAPGPPARVTVAAGLMLVPGLIEDRLGYAVYDLTRGELVREAAGRIAETMSPDGRLVFESPIRDANVQAPSGGSAALVGAPSLVDARTGEVVQELPSTCSLYAADARQEWEAGPDCDEGDIYLPVTDAEFSADSRLLAVDTIDGKPTVFDLETDAVIWHEELGPDTGTGDGTDSAAPRSIVLSPDGTRVAYRLPISSTEPSGPVFQMRGVDLTEGRVVGEVEICNPSSEILWDEDGTRIYTANWCSDIEVFDADSWTQVTAIGRGQGGGLADISVHGRTAVTIGDDQVVRAWDLETEDVVLEVPLATEAGNVEFLDESHVMVVTFGGEVLVFTLDPEELRSIAIDRLTRGLTELECGIYEIDPCPTLEQLTSAV